MANNFYTVPGGHPPQSQLLTGRAVFKTAYAFIPKDVMKDIVASLFPFWEKTRGWVLARPMSGFSETFSQYIMEVAPGGGSDRPETDQGAQAAILVTQGELELVIEGKSHALRVGSFAWMPPGCRWTLHNRGQGTAQFHWIRKFYEAVEGLGIPDAFVTHESEAPTSSMPDTNDGWRTTRFLNPDDLRYDMHVNIVTFQPGYVIPFLETHIMEHGLYVLEGKGVYRLNDDWVEVEAGDFMWLRAFCPQACYAGGPGPFRYLLYKDVNRHAPLPRR